MTRCKDCSLDCFMVCRYADSSEREWLCRKLRLGMLLGFVSASTDM